MRSQHAVCECFPEKGKQAEVGNRKKNHTTHIFPHKDSGHPKIQQEEAADPSLVLRTSDCRICRLDVAMKVPNAMQSPQGIQHLDADPNSGAGTEASACALNKLVESSANQRHAEMRHAYLPNKPIPFNSHNIVEPHWLPAPPVNLCVLSEIMAVAKVSVVMYRVQLP